VNGCSNGAKAVLCNGNAPLLGSVFAVDDQTLANGSIRRFCVPTTIRFRLAWNSRLVFAASDTCAIKLSDRLPDPEALCLGNAAKAVDCPVDPGRRPYREFVRRLGYCRAPLKRALG